MAAGASEYLPPVVTELKADLRDFMSGLATARQEMRAFARGIKDDMRTELADLGGTIGIELAADIKTNFNQELGDLVEDFRDTVAEAAPEIVKEGAKTGQAFGAGFGSVVRPLLIGAIIALVPHIVTGLMGAIQIGMGLGFIGLGAFMLRNEQVLIDSAVRLKERVAGIFRTASAPFLDPMVKALGIIEASFVRLGPNISKAFAALAPAVIPLAQGIAGMMEKMSPGMTNMLIAAGPIITAMAAQLPGIGESLGTFFQMIADNGPAIAEFIEDVGKGLPELIRGFSSVANFLMDIYKWASDLHDKAVEGGWSNPWDAWETGLKKAWDWLSSTGEKVGKWFSDRGEDISKWTSNAWTKVEEFGTKIGNWFSELPGKVGSWLAALPQRIASFVERLGLDILYWMGFSATRLLQLWVATFLGIGPAIAAGWNAFTGWFAARWADFMKYWEEAPGKVGKWLQELWNTVSDWFVKTGITIGVEVRKHVDTLIKFWSTVPQKVVLFLGELGIKLIEAWKKTQEWAEEAGKDLLRGLVRGWQATLGWAIDKVKDGANAIARGVKDALGISSPSKLFAEMGRFSALGFVQGWQGEQGILNRLVRELPGVGSPVGLPPGLAAGAASVSGAGAPRDDRPILVQLLAPNGEVLLEALIPAAQQKKLRTGTTGLG